MDIKIIIAAVLVVLFAVIIRIIRSGRKHFMIAKSSLQFIHESSNLDTILKRIEMGTKHAYKLKRLESLRLYRSKPSAEEFLHEFVAQKDNLLIDGINRAYNKMIEKANKELKTLKGKENRKKNFFVQLEQYNFNSNIEKAIDSLKIEKSFSEFE